MADIVFIHGLQGSFFSTWMVQQPSTDYHHVVCWPAAYLPAYLTKDGKLPPIRILSVGYHARMLKSSSPPPTHRREAGDLRDTQHGWTDREGDVGGGQQVGGSESA